MTDSQRNRLIIIICEKLAELKLKMKRADERISLEEMKELNVCMESAIFYQKVDVLIKSLEEIENALNILNK